MFVLNLIKLFFLFILVMIIIGFFRILVSIFKHTVSGKPRSPKQERTEDRRGRNPEKVIELDKDQYKVE